MKYFFIITLLFLVSCSSEYDQGQELTGVPAPVDKEEVDVKIKDTIKLKKKAIPEEVKNK